MGLQLKRKEVADKYVCNTDKDVTIHAKGYSGKLSNVNLSGAEHLVRSKSGYLTAKPASEIPAAVEGETVQAAEDGKDQEKRARRSNANKNGMQEQ